MPRLRAATYAGHRSLFIAAHLLLVPLALGACGGAEPYELSPRATWAGAANAAWTFESCARNLSPTTPPLRQRYCFEEGQKAWHYLNQWTPERDVGDETVIPGVDRADRVKKKLSEVTKTLEVLGWMRRNGPAFKVHRVGEE